MLNKKQLPFFIVIAVILMVISFYSGRISAPKIEENNFNNYANQGGRLSNMSNVPGAGLSRSGGNKANMLSGELISKDENNLTIKLPDGGSKIIFFSPTTVVSQLSTSTVDSLDIGQNIIANGTLNSDGSLSAFTIDSRINSSLLPKRDNSASSLPELNIETPMNQ